MIGRNISSGYLFFGGEGDKPIITSIVPEHRSRSGVKVDSFDHLMGSNILDPMIEDEATHQPTPQKQMWRFLIKSFNLYQFRELQNRSRSWSCFFLGSLYKRICLGSGVTSTRFV
ncbi:hypothetical protein K1719_044109 [Acacia pycnantha]|nr:hypothetical protein K1719_044109 [Acacia pycnantha]